MSEELDQTNVNLNKRFCPCCGLKTLTLYPEVDLATVDKYIACIMTGLPFVKLYSIYKGRINVVISGITDDFSTKAMRVSSVLSKSNLNTLEQQSIMYITYRLLPIVSITIFNQGLKKVFDVQHLLLEAMDELLNEADDLNEAVKNYSSFITQPKLFSSIPAQVLDKLVGAHMLLLKALINLGMDDSFYKGIQHA